MGLLHSIAEWNKGRQERHISRMKERGSCPQCYGRGFHTYAGHEFHLFSSALDCPGCEGSGSFSDWTNLQ